MLDIWAGEVNLTWVAVVIALLAVLPVQLLLCWRVKSLALRLAPLLLAACLAIAGLLLAAYSAGWSAVGYVVLALYGAGLMAVCAVGWGLWALLRRSRRAR